MELDYEINLRKENEEKYELFSNSIDSMQYHLFLKMLDLGAKISMSFIGM